MESDRLNTSAIERNNVLNNKFAVKEIQKVIPVKGFAFDGEQYLTTKQVADYFEINTRTIERLVEEYSEELKNNGYLILTGERLQRLKKVPDINVGNLGGIYTPKVGLFPIRAFLNIAMLLSGSKKAKELRGAMLDIVVDVVNKRAGGNVKFINQRDDTYIIAAYYNEGYHKDFIDALTNYVDAGRAKYPNYTDKIYKEIFCENTNEYKRILDLAKNDKARETMYSEVITAISSFEIGIADKLKEYFKRYNRKLTRDEVNQAFEEVAKMPTMRPMIDMARMKMASLDRALRNVEHPSIARYELPVNQVDFERFLGEKSRELSRRIEENQDVLKRLKEK